MAANKIRINTGSLNQTRKELQARLDKIQKSIEEISDDMDALQAMWDGDAHETFQQMVTADIQFLLNACSKIQGIINYEGNAVKEYHKCEQQVADLIAQIRI